MSLSASPSCRAAEPNTHAYRGLGFQAAKCPRRRFHSPRRRPAEQVRDLCGDVVPVEFVNPVAAHLRGPDDALLDKAGETAPDPDLRSAGHFMGDITNGHRPAAARQDGQDRTVQGRSHRTQWGR